MPNDKSIAVFRAFVEECDRRYALDGLSGLHQVMARIEYAEALNAKVDELVPKGPLGRSRGEASLFRQLSLMAEKAIGAFGTFCGLGCWIF